MQNVTNTKDDLPFRPAPAAQFRLLRRLGLAIMWLFLALLTLWAVSALYVDFRVPWLRVPITVVYVLGTAATLLRIKRRLWAAALCFTGFCIVLAWWLSLKPSNDADWQSDTARTAWVEI